MRVCVHAHDGIDATPPPRNATGLVNYLVPCAQYAVLIANLQREDRANAHTWVLKMLGRDIDTVVFPLVRHYGV